MNRLEMPRKRAATCAHSFQRIKFSYICLHKPGSLTICPQNMAYFTKRTQIRTQTFRKSQPWIFRKSGPYTKLYCRSYRLVFDKFEGADFKYDNSFLKFQSKNTQIRHFWSQIQVFLFLFAKFSNQTNLRVPKKAFLIKNTQIRHFWSQIQAFLFFREILQLDKCEGVDFKYYNVAFKSQPKIPKSGVFGPKFWHFCFSVKFFKQTNLRVLISNMTQFFKNSCPKIPKKVFLVKNTQIRYFWSQIQALLFLHKSLQLH